MRKKELIDLIMLNFGENPKAHNDFVDMVDAWNDETTDRLSKMKKRELELLYVKTNEKVI